jgi:hypothetical protein
VKCFYLIFCLIILSGCMNIPNNYKEPADIKVINDTLFYKGAITDLMVLQALELARGSEVKITNLYIDSGGGSSRSGIIFGNWVYKNKIKVTVDNLCFSSCANYIFTAANGVYVKKNSLIGWHGGAFQKHFTVPMRWYEYAIPNRQAKKEVYIALRKELWEKEETAFFDMIDVDQKITTYGQLSENNCQNLTRANGWNYSVNDLKNMGVNNITMEDDDFVLSDSMNKLTSCRIKLSKS